MSDISREVTVVDDDVLYLAVSAATQPFTYDMTRYAPDGGGGYAAGQPIGWGDSGHNQWLGKGYGLRGSLIKLCVGHGGDTGVSQFEIVVRIQIERAAGVVEDRIVIRIAPGIPAGSHKCLTLRFV